MTKEQTLKYVGMASVSVLTIGALYGLIGSLLGVTLSHPFGVMMSAAFALMMAAGILNGDIEIKRGE